MSNNERQRSDHDAESLDAVIDLESIPPPGGLGADPHIACTAVAPLPSALLEELRAKKNEVASSKRIRFVPHDARDNARFNSEAPTAPGKDSARFRRPVAPTVDDVPPPMPAESLVAAVAAALAPATEANAFPAPPPVHVHAHHVEEPPPQPLAFSTPPLQTPEPIGFSVPQTLPSLPSEAPREGSRLALFVLLLAVAVGGVLLGVLFERFMHHH
jgi:hypothetical protein